MIDPVPRSRKRIAPFRIHRPASVEEAVRARAGLLHAAYMGGGIDLLNAMKAGAEWSNVILLRDIEALGSIERIDGKVHIGSGLSLDALGRNETLRDALPDIAAAFAPVANVRIRNQGTLGGNVMARKAHYDILPILIACGATLTFATLDGDIEMDAAWLSSSAKPAVHEALLVSASIPETARILVHDRSHLPGFLLTVGHGADGRWRAVVAGAHDLPQSALLDLPAHAGPSPDPATARAIAEDWCGRLPIMRDRANMSGAWRRRAVPAVLARLIASAAKRQMASAA